MPKAGFVIKTKVTRGASKTQASTRVQGRDDQIGVDVNVNVGDKVFVNVCLSASEREVRFLAMSMSILHAAEFFDCIIRLLPYCITDRILESVRLLTI